MRAATSACSSPMPSPAGAAARLGSAPRRGAGAGAGACGAGAGRAGAGAAGADTGYRARDVSGSRSGARSTAGGALGRGACCAAPGAFLGALPMRGTRESQGIDGARSIAARTSACSSRSRVNSSASWPIVRSRPTAQATFQEVPAQPLRSLGLSIPCDGAQRCRHRYVFPCVPTLAPCNPCACPYRVPSGWLALGHARDVPVGSGGRSPTSLVGQIDFAPLEIV